jgi:dTDP-4-dehydrorhamnose 3,5-epimerase
MKVTPLKIPDVKLIEPEVFEDERGFFYESFNQYKFNEAIGENITFVQDNHSKSSMGVLRGLHYQEAPFEQGKLVRVIAGKVYDVAVDIRKNSPTYGKWVAEILSDENKRQLWIPEGFAHGFLTLSSSVDFLYKTTNFYSSSHESGFRYDSKMLSIDWPNTNIKLNKKDLELPNFE